MRMLTMAILLASTATQPAFAQNWDRGRDRGNAETQGDRARGGAEVRAAHNEGEVRGPEQRRAPPPQVGQERGRWEQRAQPPVVQAQPPVNPGNWGGNRNWQGRTNDTMTTNTPRGNDGRR